MSYFKTSKQLLNKHKLFSLLLFHDCSFSFYCIFMFYESSQGQCLKKQCHSVWQKYWSPIKSQSQDLETSTEASCQRLVISLC